MTALKDSKYVPMNKSSALWCAMVRNQVCKAPSVSIDGASGK